MPDRPSLRHIVKTEENNWTEIGASWKLASGSLSTRIDMEKADPFIHDGVLKFLTVENKPRAANDNTKQTTAHRPPPRQRSRDPGGPEAA